MARWTLCSAATLMVSLPTLVATPPDFAAAAQPPPAPPAAGVKVVASEFGSNFVTLGKGKSIVVDLPGDIKDVLVAEPKIANAVIRTTRRAYIIDIAAGATNIYFFDAEGKQMANFDISVSPDLNVIRAAIRKLIPGVNVDSIGDGIILTGIVQSQMEAQQAYDIASHFVASGDSFTGGGSGYSSQSQYSSNSNSNGSGGSNGQDTYVSNTRSSGGSSDGASKVVNAIVIRGRDQVMLKVTVAEVQRDVIKQLGIDLSGALGRGAVVNFTTDNPFSAALQNISNTSVAGRFSSVTGTLRAMERAGVIRTLAEPTLSAISGESANFLAGGEFPIPTGLSCDSSKSPPLCQTSIDFKKFGVSLNFTPVVLSEGRISLKVMTEVSDLSSDNEITLTVPNSSQTLTIPSIRVRRAETTVEIPSGGALAMAGMLYEQTKQQINGFPALQQVPILGALFRSRDYVNRQSELMILVTPYVVHAVAQKDLSRPDDGFADAPDPSTVLLGRLNRLYGPSVPSSASGPPGTARGQHSYRANFGFILD